MRILGEEYKYFIIPIVTKISENENEQSKAFKVLIGTLLSLRTKDETTAKACARLFDIADTAKSILKLDVSRIEKLIYPVGFYKTKAKRMKEICEKLINEYNGKVPDEIDELLEFKGVGRKTANLVLSLGFGKPGLCIDTHCHRIPNRWGWIKTKTPFDTEMELRKWLPQKYWKEFNDYLVAYGQNICRPVSPKCYMCKLEKYCKYPDKTNRK
ncbi:MAG: endonuclease III [Candidatus Woesearchaeota archaeon]